MDPIDLWARLSAGWTLKSSPERTGRAFQRATGE